MDFEQMKKELELQMRLKYGWKYPFIKLWWAIQDLYYETIIYDIVWWITDGKPQWSDADPCERKLCCKCGNKPWRTYQNQ